MFIKNLSLFLISTSLLSGCASDPLKEEERSLLVRISEDISFLKDNYPELAAYNEEHIEKGSNFISYTYDKTQSNSMVFMSRNYFWFKVSLSKEPVDPFDQQPPVFSMRMPQFKKYLKFRVVSPDPLLAKALAEIVYRAGLEAGGTDPRTPQRMGNRTPPGMAR